MLYRKISVLSPSAKLASEMKRFIPANCVAYVDTRRGIPCRPRMCIGPNVRLKKMNVHQKCHLPSRSSNIRPVIFGNQ